ncbi:hypothetical protein [Candidatus Ruminimicrobiellum ovillum]|uniref:hypothetical protein n=1 Tax=Candidatus Ruminimicrobiellum ovillum TaxID=1947927 RepID=UPI0035597987
MDYLSDILIIDDNLEEAYDLAGGFAKNKCVSIILKPEDVNDELNFIPKIICCDIKLTTSGDDVANYKLILNLLKKIFSKNKGTYLFVAWTRNKNEFDALKKYIEADKEVNQPVSFLSLDKDEFKDQPSKLKIKLNKNLDSKKGLKALLIWNEIIKEANNKTLNKLFVLSKETETDLLSLLYYLAKANLGKKINDNEIVALIKPINYILRDNIDKELIQEETKKFFRNIFKDIKAEGRLLETIEVKTNSILHINTNIKHKNVIPGDVVEYSAKKLKRLFAFSKKDENIKNENPVVSLIKKSAICGLLEVTADCDFSNEKTNDISKFVPVYLIPKDKCSNNLRNKDYFRNTNLEIEYNNQFYVFLVDCRYIFSMKSNSLYKNKLFSIRENLFTSYRQQVYSYNSRIGTISF